MDRIPRRKGKRRGARYRKGNTLLTAIISISSTLLVLFIAFLIVGNVLHNKGRNDNENDSDSETTQTEEKAERTRPDSIEAHNVLLETAGVGTFKDRVASLTSKNIRSVSVTLNNEENVILYKSPLAPSLGLTVSANVTLTKAMDSISDKGVYVSGVYYVNAFSISDQKQRSVELAKNAAIISEILDSGVNEVLIIAPNISNEHIDELVGFYNTVKSLSDKGFIGMTLSDEIIASADAANDIDKLYSTYDFLALNLIDEDETTKETVNEKISEIDSIYLYMYNIRVLLPANAETTDTFKSEMTNIGINNIQFIA